MQTRAFASFEMRFSFVVAMRTIQGKLGWK
jgi:hypothetical protein